MNMSMKSVTKLYGTKKALDDISIDVQKGHRYCLIGCNGAGKSTLINIIADSVKADTGIISFNGMTLHDNEIAVKMAMGVMPEYEATIPELTGNEYLNLVGLLHSIPTHEIEKRVTGLISYFFERSEDLNRRISTYSMGMRRKIALCAALIHKPAFLILDEPFASLDPVAATQLVQLLTKYSNSERVVFLSSHNLDYVEQVATDVGVIHHGKLLFSGPYSDFVDKASKRLEPSLLQILEMEKPDLAPVDWLVI